MTEPNRIFALINERNLSANKVAKDLGFGNSQFTAWKTGKAKPSFDALVKLADYFQVSLDYLAGRSDVPGFSPAEQNTGYSEKKIEITTQLEDDLLYEFRKLGEAKGEKMQRVVILYIQNLRKLE